MPDQPDLPQLDIFTDELPPVEEPDRPPVEYGSQLGPDEPWWPDFL